jgi:hypothetical protein
LGAKGWKTQVSKTCEYRESRAGKPGRFIGVFSKLKTLKKPSWFAYGAPFNLLYDLLEHLTGFKNL